jgi:MFS family permease
MTLPRNVRMLFWASFLLDFRLYIPVQILYFAQVTGSFAAGMSIFSIVFLSSALLELPTGVWSDRVGRRGTAIGGAVAAAVGTICYAIGGGFWMLALGAVFEGLSRALFSGNNDALLYDTLVEEGQLSHLQEYMGQMGNLSQLALASCAVLGGVAAFYSFSLVMWLSVFPQILLIGVMLALVEPNVRQHVEGNIYQHLREAASSILRNPRLRTLSIANIIRFAVGESAFLFRAAFLEMLWPLWAIGFARVVSHLTAAISFRLSGRIIRRFGEFLPLAGSVVYSETVNLLSLLFPGVLSPLAMGSTSIFFGVQHVAMTSLMQHEFTDEQRATMGSISAFAGSIVFAVFSTFLGAFADRFGVIAALVLATLIAFVRLPLFFYIFRSTDAREVGEVAGVS